MTKATVTNLRASFNNQLAEFIPGDYVLAKYPHGTEHIWRRGGMAAAKVLRTNADEAQESWYLEVQFLNGVKETYSVYDVEMMATPFKAGDTVLVMAHKQAWRAKFVEYVGDHAVVNWLDLNDTALDGTRDLVPLSTISRLAPTLATHRSQFGK